mmetsp:Transcript_17813/g.36993  ORF Transcript_17813/g.36993 Transcript_17813/m.36993 type:complete len:87 (+) Transcript_17813:903-1163(+)
MVQGFSQFMYSTIFCSKRTSSEICLFHRFGVGASSSQDGTDPAVGSFQVIYAVFFFPDVIIRGKIKMIPGPNHRPRSKLWHSLTLR